MIASHPFFAIVASLASVDRGLFSSTGDGPVPNAFRDVFLCQPAWTGIAFVRFRVAQRMQRRQGLR
jgi:hypothetical protein